MIFAVRKQSNALNKNISLILDKTPADKWGIIIEGNGK